MLLSLASSLYAGDCEPVELNFDNYDNVSYFVIGNQYNLEGLNIYLNGTIANVCPVINYKPDNFIIVFVNQITNEKIVYKSGGSHTKYIYKNITENITEYIPIEKIVYVNETITEIEQCDFPEEEEHKNIFGRFWNWLKELFK